MTSTWGRKNTGTLKSMQKLKMGFVLLVVLLMVSVIAACGGTNAANDSVNSSANNEAEVETSASESTPPAEEPAEDVAAEPEILTITHQLGVTPVAKNPSTVVVFDFGTLDTLDVLGVEVAALPQNSLPSYLSKYEGDAYKNAGGLKEPDFEAINELQPDLIIISGRQSDSYDEFTKIGPTIFMGVDTDRYMESFRSNVTLLGEIFGKEAEAEQALTEIETSIQALKETATAVDNGLITLVTGGKVSAYGAGSRFGIIHDVFGVKPVDDNIEVSTHGMSVSFEYIAEMNPEYLFVVDRDAVVSGGVSDSPAKAVIENELVKNTNAYKNGHIVYLDPNYWYLSGGGLISVSEMVREIEEGMK